MFAVGIFVHPPTPPGSEHSINESPKQPKPPLTVYCTEDVGKKIDSTVSVRKPRDADSAPQLNKPPDSTYYAASTSSSRSVNSVPTSSPRFFFNSSRPSSQHSLKTGSANDSPVSIIRRNFADHVAGRSSAIPQDSQSLKSLTASALEEFELSAEDDNLAPDSATSGLTPERPFDETVRKRLHRGPVSTPSVIVMEKTKHPVTPIPLSPKKSTLLGQESYANESRNVAVDAMPTGSCLFSRTFDEELDELQSIPPVRRAATTPTAFMFAETSSSVRDFVGYHYPGDFLPRLFWNYNLGKLIALTRFDSATGESGTILYSDSDNGKFGKTGRKEWEHRGQIVSTVWEATPKLRGRGKDALQTIYIKTLAKNDPRQLYNPIFLHALRRRYPRFPEIIGEWETQNLHVVVVRNCGLVLEQKGLYDRIIGRKFSQVDWPSFIR